MAINQDVLIMKLFSLLQSLKNFEKKYENLLKKYFHHFKECLILLLSSISELCKEIEDLKINLNSDNKKDKIEEQKKKDLTVKLKLK
jgi:hypothetical protein